VHSSFKPIQVYDFTIDILLEDTVHRVFVKKRPFVDEFMAEVAKYYEIVIFTASLGKYANPLLDILDPKGTVQHRLFRESCVLHYGNYVKDLTHLGRNMDYSIIVDNSPFSYMFQPERAVAISSWFQDPDDTELVKLLPELKRIAGVKCQDIVPEMVHINSLLESDEDLR
jgi:RNA polymerase II subunit A small phosphatase-like protein